MSYDLFLRPRSGSLDGRAVLGWFAGRANYTVLRNEIFYGSDDTGVYFNYTLTPPTEDRGGEKDVEEAPLAFNMNYFRPSYFALEAEPEVAALVEAFDLTVEDPQNDGMGTGDYDGEKFLSGWNAGNAFACRVMASQEGGEPVFSLESARLLEIWRWNRARRRMGEEHGGAVWFPRIAFAKYQGRVATFSVWPDALPSVLPETDLVVVGRKQFAPRRLLFFRRPDLTVVEWDRLRPLLERHAQRREDGTWSFAHEHPPAEVESFLRALQPGWPDMEALTADQILDRELLEQAQQKAEVQGQE